MEYITAVQEKEYVDYLRDACADLKVDEVSASQDSADTLIHLPKVHRCEIVAYDRAKQRKPKSIRAQIGWYCYETTTGICKGTYDASVASSYVALSGASLLRGDRTGLDPQHRRPVQEA